MILLISGEENFLSSKKLYQIKKKFSLKNLESNIEEFDEKSFSISEFQKTVNSVPFLSEKKLVIIKNFLNSKIKSEDEEKLIELIPQLPDFTLVVFYEKNDLDGKKKLIKKIKEKTQKHWHFNKQGNYQLEKWTLQEINQRGGSITKSAISKLTAFVGNDLWQLNQEIEKLLNYKNKKNIEESDVEKLISANLNTNIFTLIDSIGEKNLKKTLKFLNSLIKQGEEIVYILGMIVYQTKNLIIIKELALQNLPKSEIIRITKKHPFVVTKSLEQAKNFSREELENIYEKLFETETKIKTGKIEPKTGLNLLVTKLCLKQ